MNNLVKAKKYILIGLTGILAVLSVALAIETSTSGAVVAHLEAEQKQLLTEKRDFEESLVKTLSVGKLQEESLDAGFIKPINLVYITTSQAVAKLP